jgi:hypothetical protein
MVQLHEVHPLVAPQERPQLAGGAIRRKRVHPNLNQGNLAQETYAVGSLDGSNLLRGHACVEADEQPSRIVVLGGKRGPEEQDPQQKKRAET